MRTRWRQCWAREGTGVVAAGDGAAAVACLEWGGSTC